MAGVWVLLSLGSHSSEQKLPGEAAALVRQSGKASWKKWVTGLFCMRPDWDCGMGELYL